MLLSSSWARGLAWAVFLILFLTIFGLPLAVVGLASVAGQWNGVLPSDLTLQHLAGALHDRSGHELLTSLMTGLIASAIALVVGTWAALALR